LKAGESTGKIVRTCGMATTNKQHARMIIGKHQQFVVKQFGKQQHEWSSVNLRNAEIR
jgi:hypothetical protein